MKMNTDDDLRQVERYIAPDGAIHVAPEGLEENSQGLLYLNKKAVNVENDGKLTPAHPEAHVAAPEANDVMHRRLNMYTIEPDMKALNVDKGATLSQAPDGSVFSNGRLVTDESVAPIVEVENKTFLTAPVKREVEVIEGKVIPLVEKQNFAFADTNKAPAAKVETVKKKGEGMSIRQGSNPISAFFENLMYNYRIAQKNAGAKVNVTDVKDLIDWDEAKSIGLSKELLQKGGHLDKMLQGKKTDLLPLTFQEGEISINTYGRLSLKQDPATGMVHFKTNLLRNDLDLTQYCGHKLTNGDMANLKRTGNLGRTIEVKFKDDTAPKKILLSLDTQTNELIAFEANKVKVPTVIAGKELTPEQRQKLAAGHSVKIEGMMLKNGGTFTNTLQFSALEKRFVFTGEVPKIPRRLGGVELTDDQHSKLTNGETVQVIGMTDKAGKKYNAYVRWDPIDKRLRFPRFPFNPNFTQGKKAIPTNEHKTQVAANNDGHKPEALKNVQGPLEQKQPNTPTAEQATEQATKQNQTAPTQKPPAQNQKSAPARKKTGVKM